MRSLGVLISGRGSNLQALITASAAPDYPARIALVIANRADAGGLELARAAGLPTLVIRHQDHADRSAFDADLDRALRAAGVDLVCLAGFMRLLTPGFVAAWRDRLVNIHPSLLPSFKGTDGPAQALKAGVRIAGCTVHMVRAEMDAGPILVQAAVPAHADDSEASLAARILAAEHVAFPRAIALVASGAITIEGDRVRYRDQDTARSASLFLP